MQTLQINRVVGVALTAGIFNALLCWAIASEAPMLIGSLQWPPSWAGWLAVTAVGPAFFLDPGGGGWRLFTAAILMIGSCLACAAYLWKRRPDSEIFRAFILVAIVVWACCGWLVLS